MSDDAQDPFLHDPAAFERMIEAMQHTYPSKYPPGTHWATDAAWEILDTVKPGVIPDDVRAFLAGQIAGRLMKERQSLQPDRP
jgi:hypothetical protein